MNCGRMLTGGDVESAEARITEGGGEEIIDIVAFRNLKVSKSGCAYAITVKIHPMVEEFFKSLGSGEAEPADLQGRAWVPLADDQQLTVWNLERELERNSLYRIDRVGGGMQIDGEMNMSFLRLVGASSARGVTFGVRGVMSNPGVAVLQQQFQTVIRQLYRDYIKPVNIELQVSVRHNLV